VVLLPVVFAAACEELESGPVIAPELQEMDADNVMFGMTHNMTRDGIREALVEADTAYSWQDSTGVDLRNVRLVVFDENGGERAVVTALAGHLNPRNRQMFAQGNVILTVYEGDRTIESEELNYDPDANRIWSDQPTVMREGNRIIEGTGFDSDAEFTNVRVRNGRTRGGVRF
jgi:LPS export ABC transporter protein LptC